MKYFDFSLPTPAENLACDEALLDLCEHGSTGEILRFWEPNEHFVVVGYANQVAKEVDLEACKIIGVPVLRRCSGGGTVVQGPGCLNYSLILRIPASDALRSNPLSSINATNEFIMERHRTAIEPLLKSSVQIGGHTDLVVRNLKFSGNAQRRLRKTIIFHGTFLLRFDLGLIGRILPMPSKQPNYREGRAHDEFLTNLNVPADEVKATLRAVWGAEEVLQDVPREQIRELVSTKYSTAAWNLKF